MHWYPKRWPNVYALGAWTHPQNNYQICIVHVAFFWFLVNFTQMTFVSYFFILTALLGTIFIYTCKTGDSIRCKHQNRHCYTGSTCD